MYQVAFSNQSIAELNKLDTLVQMKLMDQLGRIDIGDPEKTPELGQFERDNKTLYRIRASDLRIYFEIQSTDTLYCHYILPQHTLKDFIFRFKLPVSEEQMLEEHQSFWKYLDSLKR